MNKNTTGDRAGLLSELGQQISLVFKLLMDSRVPLSNKILLPLLAAGYFIFPIDLIPDFLPGLGQLDDLALILVLMRLFVLMSPKEIVAYYRQQAGRQGPSQAENRPRAGSPDRDGVIEGTYRVVDE